jgi:dimethylhistidine N-methyltransferase
MPQLEEKYVVDSFACDVHEGLSSRPKYLQPKYFYDKVGSELFEQITEQPEYYPTRTEASILKGYAPNIRDAVDGEVSLVELGSGSSNKTTILLDCFLEEQGRLPYLPIDISPKMLEQSAERLDSDYEGVATIPIASDYADGLHEANRIIHEKEHLPDRKLVLFLGSTIGNFEPPAARSFLQMIRKRMRDGDGLLVGFDLQKEREVLHAAYNDRAGVTARFNLNLLTRINRELGGSFDLEQFSHHAFYNDGKGRVELHLKSEDDQTVSVDHLEETYAFEKEETIHTESSYKYTLGLIDDHAQASGFDTEQVFTDDKKWFALALMTPA